MIPKSAGILRLGSEHTEAYRVSLLNKGINPGQAPWEPPLSEGGRVEQPVAETALPPHPHPEGSSSA